MSARPRFFALATVGVALSLTMAACGDGGFDGDTTGQSPSPGADLGELTVGGANFTEMHVMEEIYKLLLEDAGYTVTVKTAENREIYEPALESGEIDVVPEYAATMAEFLNRKKNGPDAAPIATNDAQETVDAMAPLAEGFGLKVLEPAKAADQNGFAVAKEFADQNNLKTLSDLAALNKPLVLAATEECPDRPFCQPGLEQTYGLQISEIKPLGFGSPQTKQAVKDGTADLGLVGTTDGTLEGLGLVLLEDDKGLQLADNLVPVVNAESAGGAEVADALNVLADVLTTEDLAKLNAQVDAQREKPADVARAYLQEKGLL